VKLEQRFPAFETRRLNLRRPLQKDVHELLKIHQDEAVMQYYGMTAFQTPEEALKEIEWFKKIFAQSEGIRWVVTEQGQNSYIGDIGLHNYVPTHARAEIGFKLARAYWRQGIMTEAMDQVLRYGFAHMQLNRIEAVVDPRNQACLGFLRKQGFQEEGLLREYEREPSGFVDLVMLSLLKRDASVRYGEPL
jgi:[ribosomal protein S5]-alanine N-acetyltransferase